MKRILLLTLWLVFAVFTRDAVAATPRQTLELNINKITEILQAPEARSDGKRQATEEKLLAVINPLFDYHAMSQRALGLAWKNMTPPQQSEFSDLFSKLLAKVYMGKLLSYQDEKVTYGKETMSSEKLAEIQTRVQTSNKEIPLDYRLLLKNNEWRVYDVVVEGVSLVSNYRSQFSEFLTNKTAAELLVNLRQKVEN